MSQSKSGTDDLTLTFVRFASGFDNLKDRHGFLKKHPELLSKQAIEAANAFILDWRDKGYARSTLIDLRMFRNLLLRATEVGVDKALLEGEPAQEVIDAINALMRTGSDIRSLFSKQRQLWACPQVVGAFNFLRAKYEDDPKKMRYLEATWEVIHVLRGHLPEWKTGTFTRN